MHKRINCLIKISILMLILSSHLFATSKSTLNIERPNNKLRSGLKSGLELSNSFLDVTILPEGFFTIGTTQGKSSSLIDNNCALTYGHPWARTSKACWIVNGKEVGFSKIANLGSESNTLGLLEDNIDGLIIHEEFHLEEAVLTIKTLIKNNTTEDKNIKAFLQLDAGMGVPTGDACVFSNEQQLTSKVIESQALTFTEKSGLHKGVSFSVTTSNNVNNVSLANWSSSEGEHVVDSGLLYDVVAIYSTNETIVPAGDSLVVELTIGLNDPSFGEVFTRWNAPTELEILNGTLFPMERDISVEVFNSTNDVKTISFKGSEQDLLTISGLPEQVAIPAQKSISSMGLFNAREQFFNSRVYPLLLTISEVGKDVVEVVKANVFVPASPYTMEGLTVGIDTLYQEENSVVVPFSVIDNESGRHITSLFKENLQINVNGESVSDFSVGTDTTGGKSNLDIVFILDVTGSMSDEIKAVSQNINDFADTLITKGYSPAFGLVTFTDEVENTFELTTDVSTFKAHVDEQYAHGGGDSPENSLDALYAGSQMNFRADAKIMFIWITDESYHFSNHITQLTKADVAKRLVDMDILTYAVGNTSKQMDFYQPIYEPTGGDFFDIRGNFQDILVKIADLNLSLKMMVSFESLVAVSTIEIEVHAKGLGGTGSYSVRDSKGPLSPLAKISRQNDLSIRVVSNELKIQLKRDDLLKSEISIVDMRGRELLSKSFNEHVGITSLSIPEVGNITAGHYILVLKTFASDGVNQSIHKLVIK